MNPEGEEEMQPSVTTAQDPQGIQRPDPAG